MIVPTKRDADSLSEDELGRMAVLCFTLGLRDGRKQALMLTRNDLAAKLFAGPYRIQHARKMRQVYGAGYDIGDMHRRLALTESDIQGMVRSW